MLLQISIHSCDGMIEYFTDAITKYYIFNKIQHPPTQSRSYYKLGNHYNAANDKLRGP